MMYPYNDVNEVINTIVTMFFFSVNNGITQFSLTRLARIRNNNENHT